MTLPTPGEAYSKPNEAQTRSQIDQALQQCLKNGQTVTFQSMDAVFVSPNGTKYKLGVSNAGVTVWTAI